MAIPEFSLSYEPSKTTIKNASPLYAMKLKTFRTAHLSYALIWNKLKSFFFKVKCSLLVQHFKVTYILPSIIHSKMQIYKYI